MNRKTNSIFAIYSIIFVMFNIIALVIPFDGGKAGWIEYIFTNVAMVVNVIITWVAFSKEEGSEAGYYNKTVFIIGIIYAIVQFILFTSMVIAGNFTKLDEWIAIVISTVLLGITLILVVIISGRSMKDTNENALGKSLEKTSDKTNDKKIEKAKNDTDSEEVLELEVDSLVLVCKDEALKGAMQRLAMRIRPCSKNANENTKAIDRELQGEVDILASLIRIDYCNAMEKIKEINLILDKREDILNNKA